jgi:flavorubredoxin
MIERQLARSCRNMASELSSATNGEAPRVERHFLSISSISEICVGIQDAAAIAIGDCR